MKIINLQKTMLKKGTDAPIVIDGKVNWLNLEKATVKKAAEQPKSKLKSVSPGFIQ